MLYPIAIKQSVDASSFKVVVPDLPGCYCKANSFEQALANAKQAIQVHLKQLAEAGELPPLATSIDQYFNDNQYSGWVWALSEVDTNPYLGEKVELTIALPHLIIKHMDELIEQNDNYQSRAHFLQEAARNEYEKAKLEDLEQDY